MKIKSKKYIWAYLIVLTICSFLFCRYVYLQSFSYIDDVRYMTDKSTVIVDNREKSICLLKIREGYIEAECKLDKSYYEDGELWNSSPVELLMDGEEVYLRVKKSIEGQMDVVENIYHIDFNNEKAEKLIEYNQDIFGYMTAEYEEKVNCVQPYIKDGCIYVMTSGHSLAENNDYVHYFEEENGDWRLADSQEIKQEIDSIYPSGSGWFGLEKERKSPVLYGITENPEEGAQKVSKDSYKLIRKTFDETIAGLDYNQRALIKIAETDEKVQADDNKLNLELNARRIAFGEIRNFDKNNNQIIFGCYGNDKAYLLQYDGKSLEDIYYVKSMSKIGLAKNILIISVVTAGVFILWYIIGIKGILVVRMIRVMVVSLLVGEAVTVLIISTVRTGYYDSLTQKSLLMMAQRYDVMDFLAGVDDFGGYSSENQEYYKQISSFIIKMDDLSSKIEDFTNGYGENCDIYGKVEFFGIDKQNGTYINVDTGTDAQNINNSFEPKSQRCIEEVIETKEVRTYIGYDQDGERNYNLVYPVYDDSEETKGVFIVGTAYNENSLKGLDISEIVLKNKIIQESIIVAFMIIFMTVSLIPLNKLRREVVRLANVEERVEDKGRQYKTTDEITQIVEQFNRMSWKVQQNLDEIAHLRNCYSQYFSEEILKLFGKKSMALMHLDEACEREMYVIELILPDKYQNINGIQKLLEKLIAMMSDKKAFIAQIDSRNIVILSTERESINLAFGIFQYDEDIKIIFDYALLKLSITGYENEYRFSLEYADEVHYMQLHQVSQIIKGFIATENTFNEQDSNILSNCIGKMGDVYVYEIFVNSANHIKKLLKKDMKDAFTAYEEGRLEEARRLYVKILKLDKDNVTAKYYINKIDRKENRV